jgi:hypothetical protein
LNINCVFDIGYNLLSINTLSVYVPLPLVVTVTLVPPLVGFAELDIATPLKV